MMVMMDHVFDIQLIILLIDLDVLFHQIIDHLQLIKMFVINKYNHVVNFHVEFVDNELFFKEINFKIRFFLKFFII
jgi:hypothetical protein